MVQVIKHPDGRTEEQEFYQAAYIKDNRLYINGRFIKRNHKKAENENN
jgi:hypothetical protein